MRIATGTDGKIVVEGVALPEGATVSVLLNDEGEPFELSPEEEQQLLDSIAEIGRGDYLTGDDLLRRLQRFG